MENKSSGVVVLCDDGENRIVISRKEALLSGKKRFFTGKPCKYGHVCERMVSSQVCVKCATLRQMRRHSELMNYADYRHNFNQRRNERHKKRYKEDLDYRRKILARARGYREKKKKEKEEEERRDRFQEI